MPSSALCPSGDKLLPLTTHLSRMSSETAPSCPTLRLLMVCAPGAADVYNFLCQQFALPVDWAVTLEQAQQLLAQHAACYQVAVVDLIMAEGAEGSAVDLVVAADVAAVVLTESMTEATYQRIAFRPIADFVDMSQPGALSAVERIVRRTLRNVERHVLLVDGSEGFALYQTSLLRNQRLQVSTANGALQALEILRTSPEISLAIVDHELADGDGVSLTADLRGRHAVGSFAILGVSGADDPFVAVRFLKSGADDILRKPYLVEEYASRVNGLLDHLDTITQVRNQANRDYMTGLYNRRYLFEAGAGLFENARRENLSLAVAVIDIDYFKRINDTYGHNIGDMALIAVAKALSANFRVTDLVARIGGEEFCVLVVNPQDPVLLMERLRARIEALELPVPNQEALLRMTVSIGLCVPLGQNLMAMITSADEALYRAKQGGRNRLELAE